MVVEGLPKETQKMLKTIREFILGPDEDEDEEEMIEIRFEDLAPLWLRYNAGFEPAVSASEPELTETDVSGEDVSVQTGPDAPQQTEAPASAPATLGVPRQTSTLPAKPSSTQGVKEQTATIDASNPLYRDIIEPHINHFVTQGAMPGISKLLELLDKHSECPSIVIDNSYKDIQTADLYSVADTLMKVTLKNHSYRVAKIAMKMLKEQYRDYEIHVPKTLTAALGHDIGKIPALRISESYAKADHPLISAATVAEMFDGKDISWLNSVLQAIINHHRHSDDQFATLIRQADSKAREMEVEENNKDLTIQAWEDWFKIESVLAMVVPHINIIQNGNRWQAFSFESTVYCQPDFLYELTRKCAIENKIIDMTITCISEKKEALKKVANSLRQKEFLSCEIYEGYYGRYFNISTEKFKNKFYLVPIKIEAFGVLPNELERVKEGYLQLIRSVTISTRP